MDQVERRTVTVAGFLHGLVHSNILAIPVLLERAWRVEFSADDATLGLLAASAYAFFGVGSVPFGYLSDRRGAPGLLFVCVAGVAVSLAGIAIAPNLIGLSLGLGALGLFSGIYHPAGLSLISRNVREPGCGMGWHGLGGSMGIALGPAAVGTLLSLGAPWRFAVGALVAPAILGLALLASSRISDRVLAPVQAGFRDEVRSLLRRDFVLILMVYFFAGIAYWGSLTFLPRFVGIETYAFLLALGGVGQVAAGYVADRPRSARILLVLSLAGASLLAAFAVPSARTFIAVPWAYGLVLFSLEPLQNALVTSEVDRGSRGTAFGMAFLSVFGFGSLGAVLSGVLLGAGAVAVLFIVLGAALGMSGVCAGLAGRRPRR